MCVAGVPWQVFMIGVLFWLGESFLSFTNHQDGFPVFAKESRVLPLNEFPPLPPFLQFLL